MQDQLNQLENKVVTHIEEYNQWKSEFAARDQALIAAQEINTKNIAALTAATSGMVIAWDSAIAFQKFVRWVGSFAFLGAALLAVYHNLPDILKILS